MTWTYDGDPSSSTTAQIRFEIQDTDPNAPLLQDEEIAYTLIDEAGEGPYVDADIFRASARCCEALAKRFAAQPDQTIGDLTISYTKQAAGYEALAEKLRAKAQGSQAPFAGGQTISGKIAQRIRTDQVQPAFRRDQFRNPYTGPRDGYGPFGGR